jgi:ABC-type multidrug transport system permease subunit
VADPIELWDESERNLAKALLEYVRSHSADDITFTAELITLFNSKNPMNEINSLLKIKGENKISLITKLLGHESIDYRKIRAIELLDRQKNRKLITMLEVNDDNKNYLFSFKHGQISKPDNYFFWHKGNTPLLITKGGVKAKLRFSVTEAKVSASKVAKNMIQKADKEFINFSLYTLPGLQQNTFKQLLLIPIGALIVVIMRILVGIRTMGTFMPILFSLAFIQTTLISGIIMFMVIISAGLFIRAYLTRLQLLLVARISAVIIVVISIMSIMTIVSYRLGVEEVLQITFFPMIILSWTIERMSILWEEEGGKEALTQGGGSLLVAVIAYFAMDNTMVRYLTFNFPELLLLILSLIILIGRYTGYRLSELIRFAPLGK